MRKLLLAVSLLALAAPAVNAQTSAIEPVPVPTGAQQQPANMYAIKSANIRAGAGTGYNVIGKTKINDQLQIAGFVPPQPGKNGPGWYQLATGGFVSAKIVSPTPVTVVAHRAPMVVPAPAGQYPVGACEPYSRVVKIGGEPNQITGTACKNPDGTWSIVDYSVPTPVPAPAPVYVAPAPLVYGPPPVVVVREHPYYRRGPYGYGPYGRY